MQDGTAQFVIYFIKTQGFSDVLRIYFKVRNEKEYEKEINDIILYRNDCTILLFLSKIFPGKCGYKVIRIFPAG